MCTEVCFEGFNCQSFLTTRKKNSLHHTYSSKLFKNMRSKKKILVALALILLVSVSFYTYQTQTKRSWETIAESKFSRKEHRNTRFVDKCLYLHDGHNWTSYLFIVIRKKTFSRSFRTLKEHKNGSVDKKDSQSGTLFFSVGNMTGF